LGDNETLCGEKIFKITTLPPNCESWAKNKNSLDTQPYMMYNIYLTNIEYPPLAAINPEDLIMANQAQALSREIILPAYKAAISPGPPMLPNLPKNHGLNYAKQSQFS